jgi:hypothetical protein
VNVSSSRVTMETAMEDKKEADTDQPASGLWQSDPILP